MYTAWIKIDETLPWIELKGEYPTRREAKKAAEEVLTTIEIKITDVSKKERVKALAAARTIR